MELVHTICYPDKKEIDVFERILNGDEAIQILSTFDFNSELKKPIEFFSPSIDFIRLSDKKRLVFSGLGKRRLKEFQVVYIIPKDKDFSNVFNHTNYLGSTEYTKIVSIRKAKELLERFVSSEDEYILKFVGGIEVPEAVQKIDVKLQKAEPKKYKEKPGIQKIKAKVAKFISRSKNTKSTKKLKTFMEFLLTIIFKFLGLTVGFISAMLGIYTYELDGMNIGTFFCWVFALYMFVVTYKAKIEFEDS